MTPSHCIPYHLSEIEEELTALPLPNPRFLAAFVVALLTCQRVTLGKLANAMPGDAKPSSQVQRIRRYLDHPHLCFAPAIAALLPQNAPWILALDRTNWKHGQTPVNYLVLSVVVGNTAVPLLWLVLDHAGNSDTDQRIALIEQYLALFGRASIQYLTADREFVGKDWLAYLMDNQIPFCLRIRCTDLLTHPDGTCAAAFTFFTRANCCRKLPFLLWNQIVYVGGKRLADGDFLIVVSPAYADLLTGYRRRWSIETLFQALKGRGFDWEATGLTQAKRLWSLLGLLALGFVWCLRLGLYRAATHPDKPLSHGRLPQSWFRRGLDELSRLLAPLSGCPQRNGFDSALLALKPVPLPAKLCL